MDFTPLLADSGNHHATEYHPLHERRILAEESNDRTTGKKLYTELYTGDFCDFLGFSKDPVLIDRSAEI